MKAGSAEQCLHEGGGQVEHPGPEEAHGVSGWADEQQDGSVHEQCANQRGVHEHQLGPSHDLFLSVSCDNKDNNKQEMLIHNINMQQALRPTFGDRIIRARYNLWMILSDCKVIHSIADITDLSQIIMLRN